MKDNNIQILRGDHDNIYGPSGAGAVVKLLKGQPLYNYTDNYLYIGPSGGNITINNTEPIAVKELHGPTGSNGVEYYIKEESGNLIIQDNSEVDIKIGSTEVVSVTGAGLNIVGNVVTSGNSQIGNTGSYHSFNVVNNEVYIGSSGASIEYRFAAKGPITGTNGNVIENPAQLQANVRYYPVLNRGSSGNTGATGPTNTKLEWMKESDIRPDTVPVFIGSTSTEYNSYKIYQLTTSQAVSFTGTNCIVYVVD